MNQKEPLYLFDHQQMVKERIQQYKKILLFLDYDGTLVGFEDEPDKVKTPSDVMDVLHQFSTNLRYDVVIITGRTLADIRSKLPMDDIHYAAIHGLHILHADGSEKIMNNAHTIQSTLSLLKKELSKEFSGGPGIRIEDKTFTLAFHYRTVSEKMKQSALETFDQITSAIIDTDDVEYLYGDQVIEVRPRGWNKGTAVSYFLDRYDNKTTILPVYVGDDTTDEDAFRYLDNDAITVVVHNDSPQDTAASFWVNDYNEVLRFLNQILRS